MTITDGAQESLQVFLIFLVRWSKDWPTGWRAACCWARQAVKNSSAAFDKHAHTTFNSAFGQRSLGHTLAFPAARVRPNICIANCSHSPSTLKKGRLWAQAFSPITAALSLIPQLHAMCKFHPLTGLIPTTQHPFSNLIPKGAFDLRAYGTRSFWNVPLVSSQGLCTAVMLSLFFFLNKTRHIVWKVPLPPATEVLFLFFMLCLMKNNPFKM